MTHDHEKSGNPETQQQNQQQPTGEQRDPAVTPTQSSDAPSGSDLENDGETLTTQETGVEDPSIDTTGEATDANAGGFVGTKDEDGSAYLQEEASQKKDSDIEGSSGNFGTNGE